MNETNLPNSIENIPPFLDAKGVKRIAPLGRTQLYQLASDGQIQTVSLGMGKRRRRLFVTASILDYIRRCAELTRRPKMGCNIAARAGANLDESDCHQEVETPYAGNEGFQVDRPHVDKVDWFQIRGAL